MTQDDAHCTALTACAKLVRVPKMASAFFIVVRQVLLSQSFTFLHSSITVNTLQDSDNQGIYNELYTRNVPIVVVNRVNR